MLNLSFNSSAIPFTYFDCMKVPHFGFIWYCVTVFFCILLGVPAHAWFFWLSLQDGLKIIPTQVLPLILTVLEIFFCMSLLLDLLNVFIFKSTVISSASNFCYGLFWTFRLLIQICVCIEQYLAVLHPVIFLRYKSIQYRIVLTATIWLIASVYGLCIAFGWIDLFHDFIFTCMCIIGETVMAFCFVKILHALKCTGPGDRDITKETSSGIGNQQKRNAFHTISAVLVGVVLTYCPQTFIFIFHYINLNVEFTQCEIYSFMTSFNVNGVLIPALMKLYKQGHLRYISNNNGHQKR